MKKALVTGSSGFLGREFVAALGQRGYKVTSADLQIGVDALNLFDHHAGHFDLVVHAAAAQPNRRGIDGCPECMAYNIKLDAAMFNWAVHSRQGHVLYISSCAVYPTSGTDAAVLDRFSRGLPDYLWKLHESGWQRGQEFDVYGVTKSVGEVMAHQTIAAGTPVSIIRPFSGYGTRQSTDFPFGAFLAKVRERRDPIEIWSDTVRDFVHVSDIVGTGLELVERGVIGSPVNVCTGRATHMSQLALLLAEAVGYRPRIVVGEPDYDNSAIRVGDTQYLQIFRMPKVTLEDGVRAAVEGRDIREWESE